MGRAGLGRVPSLIAPQDARGASVGGKAIVTAWVGACRRIGRTYGTDRRTLAILGSHANRLLLMGVPPRDLLAAVDEYVLFPRSNPARIANWLAILDERADPSGKKAWAKLAAQMREAGLSFTGLRAMR